MNDSNSEQQAELSDSNPEVASEAADAASETGIGAVVETVIYGIDATATLLSDLLD